MPGNAGIPRDPVDPTAENMVTEGRVDFPFEQARAADDEPEAGELLLLSRMMLKKKSDGTVVDRYDEVLRTAPLPNDHWITEFDSASESWKARCLCCNTAIVVASDE